ncbi:hypothetical protein F6V25_16360 [Oryzomonas japonica]|uniref:Uncharacterized protein n=1 Tax=Oryzomonas japonica TaxID=2603858 RepID=A0A7J4ZM33_9BACT|nr:hypothetical protein [Oryzomonas japonica]KAB0663573.1 hypothetical protein F6V25_16360 [Oryzomonas japonica]
MGPESFLYLRYVDRQLIGFVDDDIFEKLQQNTKQTKTTASLVGTGTATVVAAAAGGTALSASGGAAAVLAATLLTGPVGLVASLAGIGAVVYSSKKALESFGDASNKGLDIKLVPISISDHLDLPVGHPRKNTLYAGHPSFPKSYIPVADFHRTVFENKFSEIISILMHLGAKSIHVEHESGWGQEFSSKLSVGIPSEGLVVGLEGGADKNNSRKILYKANFSGTDKPALPDNLIWFPHEPTWQQVSDGRIKFGMQSFSLKLQYNEDFGINLGIKAKAEDAGLDLGGNFEKHIATTWSIQGEF